MSRRYLIEAVAIACLSSVTAQAQDFSFSPENRSVSAPNKSVHIIANIGVTGASTGLLTTGVKSNDADDPHADNKVTSSGTGFTGGIGVSVPVRTIDLLMNANAASNYRTVNYAPEAKDAYAASFPIKPQPQRRAYSIVWGVDANMNFFAGGEQKVTGIPGGPFGTATGSDTFKIRNNILFTAGAWIAAPITSAWSVSLTGGFAELNQTVKYNCVTFCAVAPATGQFTASEEKWTPGGYIGARLMTPISIGGLPPSSIGIDYKHIFLESYTASLGTPATRQVTERISPDMDIVTVSLAVPLN